LSRLLWLILAVLLASPALGATMSLATSTAFLIEFLSEGRWRPLSAATPHPSVSRLDARVVSSGIEADLYTRPALTRPTGLVLVHGIAPSGKDDPRLRAAAALLARAGWAVAVPTIEGLTVLRLRREDSAAVAASVRALHDAGYRPVAVLAVSLGSSPALLAAGDPSVAPLVSAVLALGGYASASEMLRYALTGAYAYGDIRGQRSVDEGAIEQFARANADLVDAAGRRLVDNRDAEASARYVAALDPRTRHLLDELSPDHAVGRISAPLFLIHGRDDPAVPFTESLRLEQAARAANRRVAATIVGAVGHTDPEQRATAGDLVRLWATFSAFTSAARAIP
jgi:pimeloyl-ACP methyl ester carboxylesterase